MATGKRPRSGNGDVLDVLDPLAMHVIEAHALVMALPADKRADLRLLVDVLLTAVGRQIAAELPRSPLALDGAQPSGTT